jgi:hypothetical protein
MIPAIRVLLSLWVDANGLGVTFVPGSGCSPRTY